MLVSSDGTLLGAMAELGLYGFDARSVAGGEASVSGGRSVRTVQAFGAVGNGVSDDTAAIQAAIDVGPGVVAFPPGTYLVTQIVRNEGVTLAGSGVPATTIRAAAPGAPIIESPAPNYALSPTVRGGGVFDLLIDGSDRSNAGSVGINMSQNYDATIARVTIQNVEQGVILQNSAYWNTLWQVRCAVTDDAFVVTNNANENRLLASHALQCERGVVATEGADRGLSNLVCDQVAVEQFTVAAYDLETTVANAVDTITINNARIENSALAPGVPGVRITGTVRNVTVDDPTMVNIDSAAYITGALTDTTFRWRGQQKIGGVRLPAPDTFTTTSHALLYWSTAASRAFLRSSADSVFEPLQCDGIHMANGVVFDSGSGSPEGVAQYAYARGSLFTDTDTGEFYVKTTTAGTATGWVTNR